MLFDKFIACLGATADRLKPILNHQREYSEHVLQMQLQPKNVSSHREQGYGTNH